MALPQASLWASLAHSQPVPRHLVHRRGIAEVFPTDSAIDGDDILVACQLPVAHRLYNDRVQPLVDPLLILEAARQSAILCCLRHLDGADAATFVVRNAELRILHPLPQTPGAPPWNVHFRCTPSDLKTIDGTLAGGRIDLTLHADPAKPPRSPSPLPHYRPTSTARSGHPDCGALESSPQSRPFRHHDHSHPVGSGAHMTTTW